MNRPFKHRILIEDGNDLEQTAANISTICNRTEALLTVALDSLAGLNNAELSDLQIILLLEAAIGEVRDLHEIGQLIEISDACRDRLQPKVFSIAAARGNQQINSSTSQGGAL